MTDDSLFDALCEYRSHFRVLAMIAVLSIAVFGVSLFYVDPNSGTFVIAVVQLVSFVALFCGASWLVLYCERQLS